MTAGFSFALNGSPVVVQGVSTHTTLLQWLRQEGHTGSKEGCAEGDCGACTVLVVDTAHDGSTTYRAINSCITLLPSVADREIVTVEGLAPARTGTSLPVLHPVQEAMARRYGSQCGYCTPGFVCSMFEGYHRNDLGEGEERQRKVVDQLNGNLCRCTGYRPIRDAMLDALEVKRDRPADLFQQRLEQPVPQRPSLAYEVAHSAVGISSLPPAAPISTRAGHVASEVCEKFYRPITVHELLRLKSMHPEAELVGGATEIGVFINKRNAYYPFLIATDGVPELARVESHEHGYRLGGAVTLTALEEALGGAFPMIDKMLWAFASRPIRSRATLAGNLVNASPIGDMPPLLLALDAEVELRSVRGARTLPLHEFFVDYRKTVLARDEVLTAVLLPRPVLAAGVVRHADSFKVSKRRELDISITAVAFVVDVDAEQKVVHARLAFGGVAATPKRAEAVERFLVGRRWDLETATLAAAKLEASFTPLDDVRSGKDFRRGLCGSLFLKFFHGDDSEAQDLAFDFVPTEEPPRTEASRALEHESGRAHVTGRAEYVHDQAMRRDMLEVWPVCANVAHGRIKSLDLRQARSMPGVRAILTAADVPGTNLVGAIRHDEPLFATDRVEYHGQIVAMVVGDSWKQCRDAAAAVVLEVEPLPPILGCEAALEARSFLSDGHRIVRGQPDVELAKAPHRLQGRVSIGGQEHFYLESHAAWADIDDAGDVHVVSSTQHPSEVQAIVAHVLDVPRHRVVIEAPRMGGGFGGKETQGSLYASYVALAASVTGRPVRVQLDRDLDMQLTGKRHPFLGVYDVGFDGEGRLLAARVELYSDGGYALDLSESINDRGLFHLDNAYYIPHADFFGRVLKTHTVSHTAFRGFGGPQGMVVTEDMLDRIARHLGLAPEVVRERNLYRGEGESNTTHYGQALGDQRIPQIWASLLESSDFAARRQEIAKYNESQRGIKRGLAITPVKFGISFTATFLNQAGALVHLYRDGSCQVNHGGTEMGQGLNTKMLGIAMRELGLPADKIRITKTRTDKVPNTSATAASSGSDLNGQAVKAACQTLIERLLPIADQALTAAFGQRPAQIRFENEHVFAAERPDQTVAFGRVVELAYMAQVSLSATGYYRTPDIGYDRSKGRGRPFYYFAYGAAVSEVEVDGYSGMKRVRRVDILHDVGDSLNPGVDRGQIEGAFVQGTGWLTGEELKWDANGRLLSHSASTYAIPSIGDTPPVLNVQLLPLAAQEGVIHGSKAVGEPPLMLALSVREAIKDAIAAFGPQGGEVLVPAPTTHEVIYAAVQRRLAAGVSS